MNKLEVIFVFQELLPFNKTIVFHQRSRLSYIFLFHFEKKAVTIIFRAYKSEIQGFSRNFGEMLKFKGFQGLEMLPPNSKGFQGRQGCVRTLSLHLPAQREEYI